MYSASSDITDSVCLTIHRFTPIKERASTVWKIDSPFETEEPATLKSITEHPKFFPAISNEHFVLVLGSKNKLAIVLSGKRASFLKPPSSLKKFSENSKRDKSSSFERSFSDNKFLFIC